jgi:hypothetical protein
LVKKPKGDVKNVFSADSPGRESKESGQENRTGPSSEHETFTNPGAYRPLLLVVSNKCAAHELAMFGEGKFLSENALYSSSKCEAAQQYHKPMPCFWAWIASKAGDWEQLEARPFP